MQKGKAQRISEPNGRLKHERRLRGWSQARLAEQIDVPDYYISRWERGEVQPSPYYQQKLCELFGKTAQELGLIAGLDEVSPEPDAYSTEHSNPESKLVVASASPSRLFHPEEVSSGSLSLPLPRLTAESWNFPRHHRTMLHLCPSSPRKQGGGLPSSPR